MTADQRIRFAEFGQRKEKAAIAARLETFRTVTDRSPEFALERISTPFTDPLLDGPFFQSPEPSPGLPAINLVFVQSRDGNTVAEDPSALGGGETDKHVIYEGLSRVAADAVLTGAKTIGRGNMVFSIWHPALVAARQATGKPRHPIQIVLTAAGSLPVEHGLLFNVPEIPVIILSAGDAARALSRAAASKPWITVLSTGDAVDLRLAARRLKSEHGIRRISAIGGRSAATSLIDAGLIGDLYLTTSPIASGEPETPMYDPDRPLPRELVIRKQSATGIVFEHFLLRPGVTASGA